MDAFLIVVEGAKPGKVRLKLPTIIGRSAEADVKVRNSQISRQHCEIYEFEGELAVRDLDSSNGTFVNAERITEPTFLGPGDELQVGPLTLRADYQPQAPESLDDTPADDALSADVATDAVAIDSVTTDKVAAGTMQAAHDETPAATAPDPTANHKDADQSVMDEQPITAESSDASISSVMRYNETDQGSFIGIEELGDAPALDDPSHSQLTALAGEGTLPADDPSHSQIANLAGEAAEPIDEQAAAFNFQTEKKSQVDTRDAALTDFLKKLDS